MANHDDRKRKNCDEERGTCLTKGGSFMSRQMQARILFNEQVGPDVFRMVVEAPEIAQEVKSGQFFHVRCGAEYDPLLRRPISIHQYRSKTGELFFLYQVKGKGTALLSQMRPGDYVDLMGPLGNGFSLKKGNGLYVLVGGGIGIAPLLSVAQDIKKQGFEIVTLLGAQSRSHVYVEDDFRLYSDQIFIWTVDGSSGLKGLVTHMLPEVIRTCNINQILTCGPHGMLKEVARQAVAANIPCQVSLEEKMGCGVGACLSCACAIKVPEDSAFTYKKVCVDGPVFEAEEVIWDEE